MSRVVVRMGTSMRYAAMEELGGVIVPKDGGVLHWVNESGQDVFAKKVVRKPHPYLRPAADATRRAVAAKAAEISGELILLKTVPRGGGRGR